MFLQSINRKIGGNVIQTAVGGLVLLGARYTFSTVRYSSYCVTCLIHIATHTAAHTAHTATHNATHTATLTAIHTAAHTATHTTRNTLLELLCDMPNSYLCDMPPSYVWHDSYCARICTCIDIYVYILHILKHELATQCTAYTDWSTGCEKRKNIPQNSLLPNAPCTVQGCKDPYDALSLQVIFCKRAL